MICKPRPKAPHAATCDGAMAAQNSKRDVYESDTVTYLRRGTLDILEAVAVQLPDVFYGEILPKLDFEATINLAQVSKAYRDAVWSADGVRSLEEKIEPHCVKIGKKVLVTEPFLWVALHGNMPAIRACLESGVDVNKVVTLENRTALHVAAELGHAALVKALIEAGADVNKIASSDAVDSSGKRSVIHNVTPVCFAAEKGHTPCVMELITAGADVNLAREGGCTPLYMAAQLGHEACVTSLIQAGADIHKAPNHGRTPLATAVNRKREKIVAMLKHFGRA